MSNQVVVKIASTKEDFKALEPLILTNFEEYFGNKHDTDFPKKKIEYYKKKIMIFGFYIHTMNLFLMVCVILIKNIISIMVFSRFLKKENKEMPLF